MTDQLIPTGGPGALTLCLVTCQVEQVRFMSDSHVATTYVNEVTHVYVLLVSLSPKNLFRFSLRRAVSSYRPFWEKCTEWHTNDLKHYSIYKVKGVPYVLLISTRVPNFSPFRSTISLFVCVVFLSYRPFRDKCTEWSQNDLEHTHTLEHTLEHEHTPFMC